MRVLAPPACFVLFSSFESLEPPIAKSGREYLDMIVGM